MSFQSKDYEIAQIFGEPIDPLNRYTDLQNLIASKESIDAGTQSYYFDALSNVPKVYVIGTAGTVTESAVTPDTPTAYTFSEYGSEKATIKWSDLNSSREATIARVLRNINRGMNMSEDYNMINLINTSTNSSRIKLATGESIFTFEHFLKMYNKVTDYGTSFVLLVSAGVDTDIQSWAYSSNKYVDLNQRMAAMNVQVQRMVGSFSLGGTSTKIIPDDAAYLIALDSKVGKPVSFVRKRLGQLDPYSILNNIPASEDNNVPQSERVMVAETGALSIGSNNGTQLAFSVFGYESYALALLNPHAVCKFSNT